MPSTIALAAAEGLPPISRRESDDDYIGIVIRLNGRWRVIECKDRVQWVLQWRASTERARRIEWKGRSFLRTREGLFRAVAVHAGAVDPIALAALHQLPDRFPEGAQMETIAAISPAGMTNRYEGPGRYEIFADGCRGEQWITDLPADHSLYGKFLAVQDAQDRFPEDPEEADLWTHRKRVERRIVRKLPEAGSVD